MLIGQNTYASDWLDEVEIPNNYHGDPCDILSNSYNPINCENNSNPNEPPYDSGDPCDYNSSAYNEYICNYYNDSGDPCDPSSYSYNYSICNGDSGEGDTRGGNTENALEIGTPYVPAATDKLVKQNINFNVVKQAGNTCAIESLRNALGKILGKNVSLGELYIKAITISNDPDFIRKGLNDADAVKLINEYTTTKDITFSGTTAFKDAIDAGHCIIGIFPNGNIEHQVTIIGYQQNGDLIYMDSLTGRTDTRPEATFIRSQAGDVLEIINAK